MNSINLQQSRTAQLNNGMTGGAVRAKNAQLAKEQKRKNALTYIDLNHKNHAELSQQAFKKAKAGLGL